MLGKQGHVRLPALCEVVARQRSAICMVVPEHFELTIHRRNSPLRFCRMMLGTRLAPRPCKMRINIVSGWYIVIIILGTSLLILCCCRSLLVGCPCRWQSTFN